jgi:hypothetical protein
MPTNEYRLIKAGKDYPLGATITNPDLAAFLNAQRISKRYPGVVRCDDCRVFSRAWGTPQVRGFASVHGGHRVHFRITPIRKGKR